MVNAKQFKFIGRNRYKCRSCDLTLYNEKQCENHICWKPAEAWAAIIFIAALAGLFWYFVGQYLWKFHKELHNAL